jgi:hypothetical protein
MKKISLCIFFIIAITKANAENFLDFSWNFGTLGWGINYSSNDDDNFELTASLLNFTLDQKYTNNRFEYSPVLGLEFSPVKYWRLFELQDEIETKYNGERLSFINLSIYWDLIENESIIFGPFITTNNIFVSPLNGINGNEYIFSTGLRFSYKLKYMVKLNRLNKYNDQIISTEIGFRTINGSINENGKFYFSINVDLILGLIAIGEAIRGGDGQIFQTILYQPDF